MVLDGQPRSCPLCGQVAVRRVRYDHYLSLFFIPLFRVKAGPESLECGNCGGRFDPVRPGADVPNGPAVKRTHCPSCHRPVEPEFSYCPHCGQRL